MPLKFFASSRGYIHGLPFFCSIYLNNEKIAIIMQNINIKAITLRFKKLYIL